MKKRIIHRGVLLIVDGIVLFAALHIFSILRTNTEFVQDYWYRSLLPIGITWIALNAIGAYSLSTDMRSLSYTSKHLVAMPLAMAATLLFIYLFSYRPALQFSRGVFPVSYTVFFVLSLAYRRLLYARMSRIRRSHFFMVLGVDEAAIELYRASKEHKLDQSLLFVDPSDTLTGEHIVGEDSPIIHGNALEVLKEPGEQCDGIILTTSKEVLGEDVFDLLVKLRFRNYALISIQTFYEEHFRKIPIFTLSKWWIVEDDLLLIQNPFSSFSKRVVDIMLGAIGLILALPFMILIGVAIRIESRGPALFKQVRMGLRETPFTMFKFRTMHVNATTTERYTRVGDARVTRVGRLLRMMRFDELPQLWNVLKGEMSLIGPRAEWVDIIPSYEKKIPFYHIRHTVKPGITGWAQVNYKYGENIDDTIEKLQYDLYYIAHFSFMLDIDIVLKTLYVITSGKGR
jgi:exopolysaccharide biosynthesis polyprenyl glycosylphosphotransferase